ncbi:dnaJ homolog subfamily C member 1-like, partial [Stegodyphus dumicola]|uniref:dnaJ homolog subfamily C member 1-like n=1 Tax=Stegodyphus dumicola TaxID=202533 RepID=UPI0015AA89C4
MSIFYRSSSWRKMFFSIVLLLLCFLQSGNCWTTEDLELFDLVESTPQNFYDVLGVDPKASASDIRKAYRKLSTLYHPDKNKESDAEETFRRIAAVADVLRNEERRKTYDLILKTGLPDWRVPIYYYRRVRNMGLIELTIFLFCLATLAQYLFAWSAYWEKKYEIEEVVLSRIRKKAKHQRKGKNAKIEEDATVSEVMSTLQKPRCQDLFPVRLFYFMIHLIKSSPSYIATCRNYFKLRRSVQEKEETEEEPQETRIRYRKQVKPKIPDYSSISSYTDSSNGSTPVLNGIQKEEKVKQTKKWSLESLTEHQIVEFKKAIKKFPNGTLQRWEKVAAYLDCSVSEVVTMIKQLKNEQFSKNVPLSMQGKVNCSETFIVAFFFISF